MKKIYKILIIAAVHGLCTKSVSIITLSVVSAHVNETQVPFIGRLMMILSNVLYFPVITLAWYPRQYFPGSFILIPLFINSLLWALAIYMMFISIKGIFKL